MAQPSWVRSASESVPERLAQRRCQTPVEISVTHVEEDRPPTRVGEQPGNQAGADQRGLAGAGVAGKEDQRGGVAGADEILDLRLAAEQVGGIAGVQPERVGVEEPRAPLAALQEQTCCRRQKDQGEYEPADHAQARKGGQLRLEGSDRGEEAADAGDDLGGSTDQGAAIVRFRQISRPARAMPFIRGLVGQARDLRRQSVPTAGI